MVHLYLILRTEKNQLIGGYLLFSLSKNSIKVSVNTTIYYSTRT